MTTTDSASSRLDPRWREMLLFVLLVPTTLALTDTYLLNQCVRSSRGPWLWSTYLWFCVQTAVVGYWVGYKLDHSRWWWGILAWSLLLIDIQVFAIASPDSSWSNPSKALGYAFASGQTGLAVVWSLLGLGSWRMRAPLFAGGLAWAITFGMAMNDYAMMVLLIGQTLATAACCFAMRMARFRFERVEGAALMTIQEDRRLTQFSIRHLFYWTTTVGILAGVARWLHWSSLLIHIQWGDIPYFFWFTIVLTVVSMIATWTALGREAWPIRTLVGVLLLPAVGAAIGFLDVPLTGWGWISQLIPRWLDTTDRILLWAVWTSLAGLFLAGILLVFRASGLRLVRMRKRRANNAKGLV